MNAIVLYSLQTIISAGLFILIYHLFVRNTNSYNWNRFYLLITMILSLFLPMIDISSWFTIEKPVVLYVSTIKIDQAITVIPFHKFQNSFNVSDILIAGYWGIVGLLFIRFGWGITCIIDMISNNNYEKKGKLKFYPIQRKTTFSFFNHIFIQPEYWDTPITDYIIQHELAHVNNVHSLDKIVTELILVFGWFNPFYYIFRRDLQLVHECQADNEVVKSGCDKMIYHQILLNQINGNLNYRLTNQFSYSLLASRFEMISNDKQSRFTRFRNLLAIPATFILLLLFSSTSLKNTASLFQNTMFKPVLQNVVFKPELQNNVFKSVTQFADIIMESDIQYSATKPLETQIVGKKAVLDVNKETSLAIVERQPEFPGGDKAMFKYIKDNIDYPSNAEEEGITGTVLVSFVVSKTGKISNTRILRGVGKACDEEAKRVINEMPLWLPGKQNGRYVPVLFQIPIKFNLQPR
jgi:TonB family protein